MKKQADDIKSEMIDRMGHDFGTLYYHLYNETAWLTMKWLEYKELYGTKESRIELMNKTAPTFFYIIEETLWNNILLGITRLTDPEKSMGRRNITVRSLSNHIHDLKLKQIIDDEVNGLIVKSEFCKDWRNRSIAHFDYELNINQQSAKPLEPASRKKLQEAIDGIHSIIKKVHFKYLDSNLMLEMISGYNGSVSLLMHLKDGLRFSELKYKRKLSGEWHDADKESLV